MARNVFIDLEKMLGKGRVDAAQVVEDSSGRAFLHCLVGEEAGAVDDYGNRNTDFFEFGDDMPAKMKRGNASRHEFFGHPVHSSKPA